MAQRKGESQEDYAKRRTQETDSMIKKELKTEKYVVKSTKGIQLGEKARKEIVAGIMSKDD